MSRHLLIDRSDFQLVVGFDHMLSGFFGQVFNPSKDAGIAIAGWPTSSGLGTRRPADNHDKAGRDLKILMVWARDRTRHLDLEFASLLDHFRKIERLLSVEWSEGEDAPVLPVPAALREPRP